MGNTPSENAIPFEKATIQNIARLPSMAVAALSIVLALVVAFAVSSLINKNLKERNGRVLSELAYHMAETLDSGLYERFNGLLLLSQFSDFPGYLQNPHLLRNYFNQQQKLFPEYAWIGFVRPDGTVFAGSGGLLERKNILDRPWVTAGMKAPFAGDVHEAMLFSALLPRPQDGEPLRLVDLSLPVYGPDNRLLGVLGAHLSWEWAKDLRKNLQSHNQQGSQLEILVLNKEGKVLLGNSGDSANGMDLSRLESYRQAVGFMEGSLSEQWLDGKQYITGYARSNGRQNFKGLGWIVLVRQSDAVVQAEGLEIRLKALGLGGFIGLVSGFFCWTIIRRGLSPLEQLSNAVHQMNRDQTSMPLVSLPGSDCFSELTRDVYNRLHMLRSCEQQLRDVNNELQYTVERSQGAAMRHAEQRRGLELQVMELNADLKDAMCKLQLYREQTEQQDKASS